MRDATVVTLLLARHGETEWNRAGRYQGRSDPPLSPVGEAAASMLARDLAATPITAVLTSPLRRAAMTAERIAAEHGLSAEVDDRLAELGFGAWEGLTQAEVKTRWPALLRQWKTAPETVRFPDGESLAEARARLFSNLADLSTRFGADAADGSISRVGAVVVLVTHDAIMRMAMLAATGQDLAAFRQVSIPTCSVRRLIWSGGRLGMAEATDDMRWSTDHRPTSTPAPGVRT